MRRRLLLAAPALALPGAAAAQEMRRPVSWQQRRFQNVVRQVLEFSCGSAALATVLSFYHRRETSESDVITILRERYDTKEKWTARAETGFSFADLMFAADRLGFASQAARVAADQLPRVAGPLIVHLDKGAWQHFSVLRLTQGDVFWLADPMAGQTSMLGHQFRREYSGAALAVWRRGQPLPQGTPLQAVRDGLSVEATLASTVRAAGLPPNPLPSPF